MTFNNDGTYTDRNGVVHPSHEDGVKWPNHLHKNATYPCAEIRADIMREVLKVDSFHYSDHEAYPYVLKAMHQVLEQADSYLFRQYYHRDLAIKALTEGNTELALDHLNKIGV